MWCSEIPATMQRHIVNGKLREHEDKYIKYINESPFEKVHVKFCKMILGVKKQTSNIACRAEMGRFPLHLEMYVSMIKYWLRLNKTPRDRLTADALKDNLFMQESGLYTWTSMIKSILEDTNYSEVWTNKGTPNETKFIKDLRVRLEQNLTEMTIRSMHNDNRNNKAIRDDRPRPPRHQVGWDIPLHFDTNPESLRQFVPEIWPNNVFNLSATYDLDL